jgi:hypothetical protein
LYRPLLEDELSILLVDAGFVQRGWVMLWGNGKKVLSFGGGTLLFQLYRGVYDAGV